MFPTAEVRPAEAPAPAAARRVSRAATTVSRFGVTTTSPRSSSQATHGNVVTPASSTRSSCAVGVRAPVLPTLIVIVRTRVVAWRAANL